MLYEIVIDLKPEGLLCNLPFNFGQRTELVQTGSSPDAYIVRTEWTEQKHVYYSLFLFQSNLLINKILFVNQKMVKRQFGLFTQNKIIDNNVFIINTSNHLKIKFVIKFLLGFKNLACKSMISRSPSIIKVPRAKFKSMQKYGTKRYVNLRSRHANNIVIYKEIVISTQKSHFAIQIFHN